MTDIPANPNIHPKRHSAFWFRFFEILPGAVVWSALLSPIIISFYAPLAITIFILIFDVYFMVQTINYGYLLSKGYRRLRKNVLTDWQAKLAEIAPSEYDWKQIYQTVILVAYKEDPSILEASLQSIVDADYPKDHFIVVLATEERAGAHADLLAEKLTTKFAHHFHAFIVTKHPDNIVGEVKAKGANASWAAKELVRQVEAEGIPLENIIVSTADCDTRFNSQYFLCLSYQFAMQPDRIQCAYQPIATFFNNIWDAPMISRVMAFGTTFWQIVESVRDYRMVSFSTHAMSLRTLVDMNYWSTSIVNEDSRQFFRAFFHYNGEFRTVPLFMPIYMDAVHNGGVLNTMHSLYFQQQRWAYGVEHFPYIVLESIRRKQIPFIRKFMLIWRAFLGTFTWATTSIFITVVGWIPILLNASVRDQVIVSNFVVVTKTILSSTWLGLIVSCILTYKILQVATEPQRRRKRDWIGMIAQWVLVPVAGLFFGCLPCLDSITRLMLGKYMGFKVTSKASAS